MFGKTPELTGAIVLGVQDDAASRQAVREAAQVAVRERKTLHLVAAHDLRDSYVHRAARSVGPHDMEYMLSPHGDGEALIADLAELVSASGVTVVAHVHHGSLRAAVKKTTKTLAAMPMPAAAPARTRRPRPVPAPMPVPELAPEVAVAPGLVDPDVAAVPTGRFRRRPTTTAAPAAEAAAEAVTAEGAVAPVVVAGS